MGRLKVRKREQGVTLVELMIVVGLLGMVVSAMYNMFTFQQKSYTTQDNVAVMQQNVRVGLEYMVKNIRMAGYIPEDIPPYNAGPTADVSGGDSESIEAATANSITLQADIDADAITETVRYILNGGNDTLTREVWKWDATNEVWGASAGDEIIAENIDNLVFSYILLADDQGLNDDVDNDGDGQADEEGELMTWDFGTGNMNVWDRSFIRQINVTMTARSNAQDASYTHPQYGDNYRRRILSSNINLRNLK